MGLSKLYDGLMLEQAEIAVASVPWDVSPALRQKPTLNPSYGSGDVVPGTLLHSGEMSLEATDVLIPGRGFDFVFTRTYRSQTVGSGPLGPGWDHSYRMRLRPLPNGDVELFDGRGRRELFRRQDDGTFKAPAGRFVSLERVASGWVLVDAGRNLTHFDRDGRLTSIADAVKRSADTGNEMRFYYDVHDRLARVNDTLDRD
ncbi:MAG: hypothetical protein GY838_17455, partial [bacterium]|nr:hypothetical protein [bacterium]